jgi:hypothetical protein
MADAFAARDRLFSSRIFATLLIRIRFVVGCSVQQRKENWIGRKRIQRAQERPAPLRRNLVDQLMEPLFFPAQIRRHYNIHLTAPGWPPPTA